MTTVERQQLVSELVVLGGYTSETAEEMVATIESQARMPLRAAIYDLVAMMPPDRYALLRQSTKAVIDRLGDDR